MGQPIRWSYALVWRPDEKTPHVRLYRQSSAGHLFQWAEVPAPAADGTPTVDRVLEELYTGLLALMEQTA